MASVHSTQFSRVPLPCDSLSSDDLRASLEALTTTSLSLLETLREYRKNGRPGHSLTALWRAYLASFLINVPHTNALIRRLQDDADFRALCGFGDVLPHRTTFNRFIQRLSHHATEVEGILAGLTCRLREFLPDLGGHSSRGLDYRAEPQQPQPESHKRPGGVLDSQELPQGQVPREGMALRLQVPHGSRCQVRAALGPDCDHRQSQRLARAPRGDGAHEGALALGSSRRWRLPTGDTTH